MKLIEKKIKSGKTEAIEDVEVEEGQPDEVQTINFMDVLKRSVEGAGKKKTPPRKKQATKKKPSPRKSAAKKRKTG